MKNYRIKNSKAWFFNDAKYNSIFSFFPQNYFCSNFNQNENLIGKKYFKIYLNYFFYILILKQCWKFRAHGKTLVWHQCWLGLGSDRKQEWIRYTRLIHSHTCPLKSTSKNISASTQIYCPKPYLENMFRWRMIPTTCTKYLTWCKSNRPSARI